MMTLSITSTPTSTSIPNQPRTEPDTDILRLRYECSSPRQYTVWLLTRRLEEETEYRQVFADLERSSRRENRHALLIDLRQQHFFYRTTDEADATPGESTLGASTPGATAPGRVIRQAFGHDTLCIQLAHYLLNEVHHKLAANEAFITSLAGNLTACLIKETTASPEGAVGITPYQLKQIEQYTQSHMDHLVTLDELAAVVRLSSFHFSRQFKQAVGETPYQYVIRIKMQHAKAQLLTTEASVINIGMQVGYENSSHFSRAFKRSMGVSPTQLRKTLREEPMKLSA